MTSPGPRCLPHPPPAQHLICSERDLARLCPRSSPLLGGFFTVCEGINPVEEGGHGLGGPLSPPGPPEPRPQEAEPPKVGYCLLGGLCKWAWGAHSQLLPSTGIWGGPATSPRPIHSGSRGAAHVLGSMWGSISCSSHSSDTFGTEFFTTPAGRARQCGVCQVGWSMPWDLVLQAPQVHPRVRTAPPDPLFPTLHPSHGSHSPAPSHLPSWPGSDPIPLTPPALGYINPEQPQLLLSLPFTFFLSNSP